MNHDEQDDLWRLLGKAKQPRVSPFFSRDVLRTLRHQRQERSGWFGWLGRHWQVAIAGACALMITGLAMHHTASQKEQITLLAQQVSASPDYAVIGHLDELLESEENSVWLDNVY